MNYSRKQTGEGNSPYWDWTRCHQPEGWNAEDGHNLWEAIEANPDLASKSLWNEASENDIKENISSRSLIKQMYQKATPREKEVIKLLQKGNDLNSVARKLRVSISTIKTLVQRIRYKASKVVVQKPRWGDIVRPRKLV